ncbi:MAG: thioredoxin domain-containing protein [Geminicoccaceae bacterium]
MAPVLGAAAHELEPMWPRVAKLDTDAVPEIAARHGIRSIPTLILFRNGSEVARWSGAMPAGALRQWVEAQLAQRALPTPCAGRRAGWSGRAPWARPSLSRARAPAPAAGAGARHRRGRWPQRPVAGGARGGR